MGGTKWLVAAVVVLGASATVRRADACTWAQSVHVDSPSAGELDVPTDVVPLITGYLDTRGPAPTVTLTDDAAHVVTGHVAMQTAVGGVRTMLEFVPDAPLAPHTHYTLRVIALSIPMTTTADFTTGDGPSPRADASAPPLTASVGVIGSGGVSSCGGAVVFCASTSGTGTYELTTVLDGVRTLDSFGPLASDTPVRELVARPRTAADGTVPCFELVRRDEAGRRSNAATFCPPPDVDRTLLEEMWSCSHGVLRSTAPGVAHDGGIADGSVDTVIAPDASTPARDADVATDSASSAAPPHAMSGCTASPRPVRDGAFAIVLATLALVRSRRRARVTAR